ncbi:SMI1/KNR4 family protein [Streptomyces sp. NPDC049597]|uniref:SMI1/KNR4 family protein n=1 Tax=Streptomyces sp. NPDC049597 TaxID=3155276 RepID=UPI0034168415
MNAQMWVGVRERVQALAGTPGAVQVFGFHGHGFRLEDPLTPQELAALEERLGVRLPEDYRAFLLHVGAGGAGPAYGVFPVQRGEDGEWEWDGDGGDMASLDRMTELFPVDRPREEALAAHESECPDEDDFDDPDAYDAAYEAWDERDPLWSDDLTVGAICLCHLGCALRRWLVVSGPDRGRMWDDRRADGIDLQPMSNADGSPMTFADWYLTWLEEAERQARDTVATH